MGAHTGVEGELDALLRFFDDQLAALFDVFARESRKGPAGLESARSSANAYERIISSLESWDETQNGRIVSGPA